MRAANEQRRSPYEQKTQQSPGAGRRTSRHAGHLQKKTHALDGISPSVFAPHCGHVKRAVSTVAFQRRWRVLSTDLWCTALGILTRNPESETCFDTKPVLRRLGRRRWSVRPRRSAGTTPQDSRSYGAEGIRTMPETARRRTGRDCVSTHKSGIEAGKTYVTS